MSKMRLYPSGALEEGLHDYETGEFMSLDIDEMLEVLQKQEEDFIELHKWTPKFMWGCFKSFGSGLSYLERIKIISRYSIIEVYDNRKSFFCFPQSPFAFSGKTVMPVEFLEDIMKWDETYFSVCSQPKTLLRIQEMLTNMLKKCEGLYLRRDFELFELDYIMTGEFTKRLQRCNPDLVQEQTTIFDRRRFVNAPSCFKLFKCSYTDVWL